MCPSRAVNGHLDDVVLIWLKGGSVVLARMPIDLRGPRKYKPGRYRSLRQSPAPRGQRDTGQLQKEIVEFLRRFV